MKILMLLESVFPQDERVEKEIASLLEAGHELRIATYSFDQTPFEEPYQGYTIYRSHLSGMMYKFGAAILVLPFYFRFWRKYLDRIYRQWKFEALHIHDLPLARLGYEYKTKHEVRFVADQHEFYSSWIVKTAHYNTFLGRIIRRLSNWTSYEEKYLATADLVCTVEEPLRALYLKHYDLDREKLIVIPNTPLKRIYNVPVRNNPEGSYKLYYHGGLDILRGLDTAITALPLIRKTIPEIRLVLVGKTNKHYNPQERADELGVGDLLEIRSWVDYRELPHEIDRSNICFFTPPANREEINNTIATKIYQYMARAKPVIVGSARYMKEFVEKFGIGVAINERNPEEFAKAVLDIYSDPELNTYFSQNARKHMDQFYWEHTVKRLVRFYASLD